MNETKSLIPPTFVNVPSDPVYDAHLPDPLFRTYIRLRGLAWQSKYRETPPLRVEELAEICHHNVRSTWGHLSALRKRGLVTWHTVQGRMVFDLQPLQKFAVDDAGGTGQDSQERPELLQNFAVEPLQNFAVEPLQNFAVHNDGGITATDPPNREQQQPSLLQKFAVDDAGDTGQDSQGQAELLQNFAVEPLQKFAVDYDGVVTAPDSPDQGQQQQPPALLQNFAVSERETANLAALVAYGVDADAPTAQETARLDHVTPDLVQAWGAYLSGQPCRNLPGLLLYKLRTTQNPPRTGEQRGGNRQATPATSASQDALPIPESAEQPERQIVTVDAAAGLLKRRQARGDHDAVALLLDDFGIVPPASVQVLARSPHPDDVRGWMLYTLGQAGLAGKAQGYVVNRLLAGETSPGRFRRWARLEPEEWQALWHAARYGGTCAVDADPAAWREDFSFPAGPFGNGQRLAPKAELVVASPDEETPQATEWQSALDELQLQMTQATFDTWLKGSELVRCEGDTFVVGVKSTYAKEWLEHRLLPVITRTLSRQAGHSVNVEFVAAEER